MNVRKIMSCNPVTVRMDDSLQTVKEIFDHARFHHLLVMDGNRLFGIISDRDLLKSISPYAGTAAETSRDVATLNKRAHQIMSRKPITIHADADVEEAIRIFNSNRISCLPVVDDQQHPVGIVCWRDIFKIMSPNGKDTA